MDRLRLRNVGRQFILGIDLTDQAGERGVPVSAPFPCSMRIPAVLSTESDARDGAFAGREHRNGSRMSSQKFSTAVGNA